MTKYGGTINYLDIFGENCLYQISTFIVVPTNFLTYTVADVYYSRIDTSVADGVAVINYTFVANSAQVGLVTTILVSIVGTDISEDLFRFSDESLSREYSFDISNPHQLQTNGSITFITDSIVARNNPTTRFTLESRVYDFFIGATIIAGGGIFGQDSFGLIDVLPFISKLFCLTPSVDIFHAIHH